MTDQHATTSNQNQAHSQTKVTPKTSTKAKTKPNTSAQDKPLGTDTIRWDLSDLYRGVDDPGILNDVQSALKQAQLFQKQYKGKLSTLSATQLATAYAQCEALLSPVYKASQYVGLLQAIDSLDDTIKALETKIDDLETEISNQLLFFDIELGQLPAEMLDRLIQDRGIGQYRYELQRTKETARHNLTEPEEKILNIAGLTGASAFKKLYNELTASFEFEFELDGVVKKMNGSELRALRQHPDPDVRRRAMTLFFDRYRDNQLVLTHVFNNVVKEFNTTKDLRHYPSAISRRNIGNDLDDESVRILHDITTESYSLVQRYYRLKSRLIQLPDMTLADIYAPMPDASERFSWDESKAIILDGFSKFDATFYQMAKQMFDENRIDAHVEPRKRGGAFCSGSTPYVKPYVMMNFLGRQSDISTLAHELGHAIHDMLAAKQSLFNFHPILPLAETASVFCEMIITDKLLAESRDDATKIAILTDKLEDIFATSHRQNMFSRFEMAIHDRIPNTLMSQHDFCEMYHRELQTMFGDSVRITPEYHWEWSSIPHMISYPFYVYAYNFGNLLVMALYQQYKEEGPSFVPKLTQFLSSGSSLSPMDICSFVNADIRDPNFWRKSITLIESMLTQLEALV